MYTTAVCMYVHHIMHIVVLLYCIYTMCANMGDGIVTLAAVSHRGRESVKFQFLRRL